MIETFLFARLCEGQVCRNVAWKLQKCCKGWKESRGDGDRKPDRTYFGKRFVKVYLVCLLKSLNSFIVFVNSWTPCSSGSGTHDQRRSSVAGGRATCSQTYIGEKRAHCPAFIQLRRKMFAKNVRGVLSLWTTGGGLCLRVHFLIILCSRKIPTVQRFILYKRYTYYAWSYSATPLRCGVRCIITCNIYFTVG